MSLGIIVFELFIIYHTKIQYIELKISHVFSLLHHPGIFLIVNKLLVKIYSKQGGGGELA